MNVAAIEREMDEVLSNTYDFQGVLDEINVLDGDSMEAKLAILNQCKCCDRHQINKPNTFAPWQDCESSQGLGLYEWTGQNLLCECDCRHMARWICRACTDDSSPTQTTQENTWFDPTTTGITEGKM